MTMYFKSRSQLRSFAGSGKRIDLGATAPDGRRWAVQIQR